MRNQYNHKARRVYDVEYIMFRCDTPRVAYVVAGSKEEAYDVAVYEHIPKVEHSLPYAAWVSACTYANGNYRRFENSFCGNPIS